MQLSSILFATRARILILFTILSMVLVACDMSVDPESENLSFEGPPEVTIASPLNGDTYQEGVGVNILLRVDNAGPDIARIAIEVDGQIIGEAVLPNPNGDANFTVNNGWPASGAGAHTISAIASRSDGTISEEASVTINVVAAPVVEAPTEDTTSSTTDEEGNDTADDMPVLPTPVPTQDTSAQQVAPTQVQQPTTAASNTPAPTNTPSQPQATIRTGANVRRGPGLAFDPPIGSLAAGASANLLAINTAGTWYKIQYYNGDGWISALVADVTGDTSSLPREAGPPTPIPATPTPAATATPSSAPDLSATNVIVNPHPFVCNQSSSIQVIVANTGNAASVGTSIRVVDVYNGQEFASTTGSVPAIQAGGNATVEVYLTVSNNFAESHHTRIIVDPNGQVAESDESNNVRNEAPYVLATGKC